MAVVILSLYACEGGDFTTWATVTAVQEVERHAPEEEVKAYEEELRTPEPAFEVELRTDDGDRVTLEHHGERRYAPGERVRVIKGDAGALLL